MLDFDFPTEICAKLKSYGADPRILYSSMEQFSLQEAVQDFKPVSQHYKAKRISAVAQLEQFQHFLDSPLEGHPLISVCSFPSDARAKIAALHMFRNAMYLSQDRVRKPRWVTLYSDRFDYESLRSKRPAMLFFSNVILSSTAYKLDRLRDLLEMFADIPRVVVTGGTLDATDLVVRRLHLPVSGALSIGPKHVVTNLLSLMESGEVSIEM